MDPYVGEIRIFAGNFAPKGWALCDGSLLSIQTNTALFSLLGTTYGGNGKTNFALPDLRGRAPMHFGTGQGLTPRSLGESGGSASVQLTVQQMPSHNHVPNCVAGASDQMSPAGAEWGNATAGRQSPSLYSSKFDTPMSPQAIGATGGGAPHNNMQPYLVLNYIIALQGVFPPRPS
ncbi:phage tail protein [Cohnella pontilimi]|uniref:Phage tail protein n=1 Tax=Cohnella pontilimi TaxID=2564100 RepID=A0A4U0FEN0_9BACL|nr:tail fiber protein [Cohnella pontilimi]TJY42784.1 phage tail protein [Cohnella pontilimi]